MLAALALVTRALDHVPDVRHHTRIDETLSVLIEINAPWIARAFRKNFKSVLRRMIPPHCCVHPLPLLLRRPWLANVRRAEYPVATIEPAVRTPCERVQRLVRVAHVVPAVQQNLRLARGF